jgi:thioredoxin-like negative regulator of GroEL
MRLEKRPSTASPPVAGAVTAPLTPDNAESLQHEIVESVRDGFNVVVRVFLPTCRACKQMGATLDKWSQEEHLREKVRFLSIDARSLPAELRSALNVNSVPSYLMYNDLYDGTSLAQASEVVVAGPKKAAVLRSKIDDLANSVRVAQATR